MGQQQTGLVDPRLAKALSHPLRAHILAILDTRVASPNEIAEALGERLPNVSYHVRCLHDLGCVELVRTTPRRGAIEHYYRASVRPFFSDRDWERLPRAARQAVSDVGVRLIWQDLSASMRSGTFERRSDRYLTRSPLVLDEPGWKQLNQLLADLLDASSRIARESADRLSGSTEEGIPTKLVLMHFESPRAEELSGRRRGARKV